MITLSLSNRAARFRRHVGGNGLAVARHTWQQCENGVFRLAKKQGHKYFSWESGFDRNLILKTLAAHRKVNAGKSSFDGMGHAYWLPVLNSAVRAHESVGSLKNRCISESVSDPSILLKNPNVFLERCDLAFDRLRQRPRSKFVLYSSLTYGGPQPIRSIRDGDVRIAWYPANATNAFIRKADGARKQLSHLLAARKVKTDVTNFSKLLTHVDAHDAREAFELANDSVDRLRGMLNLLINSSRGVNPFHDLSTRHAMNQFRRGPYHTMHKPDGSLAAEMFWYEPRWHHEADSVKFADAKDYGKAIRKWWGRFQSNPLRVHIADGLVRYCRALDLHDFEPSLIGMWSVLESMTGSSSGDVVVKRIKRIFEDHREAGLVANHVRIRRNSTVHSGTTPQSSEHDAILVQLNILVSRILFFCLSDGKKFKSRDELTEFLEFRRN